MLTSLRGNDLGGRAVLDAFAGSGALGIEALSRGASSATFLERDPKALDALRANVDSLGVGGRACIVAGDTVALGSRGAVPGGPFALILLDPPYRLALTEVQRLVSAFAAHNLLEEDALVVLEHAAREEPEWPESFRLAIRKRYGTTEIDIAVYRGEPGSS